MKALRLFPAVPYTRQRGRHGEIPPRNPPFTRYELARIQKRLLTCLRTAACPRCHEVFAIVRRARYGHQCRESWLVGCTTCQRQIVIPVHRDPEPEPLRFDQLPLSVPKRHATLGDAVARIGSAVAVSALFFTGMSTDLAPADPVAVARMDTMLVVFADPPDQRLPEVARVGPAVPVVAPVIVPNVVPVSIPPIDLALGAPTPTMPRTGQATGRSSFAGLVTEAPVDQARALSELDSMPQLVAAGPLRYPHDMRMWGVEGEVEVEFVLDAMGRVEPNTIVIVSSAHEAFNGPAREAVLRSVYRPGMIDGRPVRVAVSLTLQFALSGPANR